MVVIVSFFLPINPLTTVVSDILVHAIGCNPGSVGEIHMNLSDIKFLVKALLPKSEAQSHMLLLRSLILIGQKELKGSKELTIFVHASEVGNVDYLLGLVTVGRP